MSDKEYSERLKKGSVEGGALYLCVLQDKKKNPEQIEK
jgi:hypothetical protein